MIILLDTQGDLSSAAIKDELSKLVIERFEILFEKIRLGGADVLGVGQYFRHDLTRPQLEDWRTKYFPNLKIDLEVSTSIRNTGNLKGT